MILLGLHFSSCTRIRGEGPTIREQRTVGNFTEIRTACDADVYIRQDSNTSLELSGQQNVLQQLKTELRGSELKIDFDYRIRLGAHERIQVFITCPDIRKVSISGSGNTQIRSVNSRLPLALAISGSGSIEAATVRAAQLNADISGSGSIRVDSGSVATLGTDISGSGSIDVSGVTADVAEVNTSGSGDTRLKALELLQVRISGSGDVYYLGRPAVSTKISGSGKVLPL